MARKDDLPEDISEQVRKIPIRKLVPFKDHPFKVIEDESMLRTTESIAMFGVLTPLIARPLEDGTFEIISGHRRVHAAELAGLTEVPVIVRQMDDDAATVLMVDSNLQRESILPSERSFAYKMKNDAMKRTAGRPKKENVSQLGTQKRTDQLMAEELSYLTPEEQRRMIIAMDYTQAAPSLSQAQRLKKMSQEGECSLEDMCDILGEVKKGELDRVSFKNEQLKKYFPKSYTTKQMSDVIIKLLEQWQRKRQRDQER